MSSLPICIIIASISRFRKNAISTITWISLCLTKPNQTWHVYTLTVPGTHPTTINLSLVSLLNCAFECNSYCYLPELDKNWKTNSLRHRWPIELPESHHISVFIWIRRPWLVGRLGGWCTLCTRSIQSCQWSSETRFRLLTSMSKRNKKKWRS